MLIEEIIRSCRSESVAQAAVASIGASFARDVAGAAERHGMSVGGFTVHSVERFARQGDESQMRSVLAAMDESQEPVLAGLHRILSIGLASCEREKRYAPPRGNVFRGAQAFLRLEQRVERHA